MSTHVTTELVGPHTDSIPEPSIRESFVDAFRRHPAGVAIITATGNDGPVGITSSSVMSISADPAVLAFSLQSLRGSAAAIADASSFLVHLAHSENVGLAQIFATRGTVRFGEDMDWSFLSTGEPFLHGTAHALRAVPLGATACGSALIVTAEVVEVIAPMRLLTPLVYHDRAYHHLTPATHHQSKGTPQ